LCLGVGKPRTCCHKEKEFISYTITRINSRKGRVLQEGNWRENKGVLDEHWGTPYVREKDSGPRSG